MIYALLLITLIIGIPFAFVILGTLLVFMVGAEFPYHIRIVAQQAFGGLHSFPLLAVPLFILAGEVMNEAGITRRIIALANALVGHMRAGLTQVNIWASVMFAGLSGSAIADTSTLGRVLLIGAGGVGRAVACALGALGATSIDLVERDAARGEFLRQDLNRQGIVTETRLASEAETHLSGFDGIVNCTPVGHINHPGCPIKTDQLHDRQWVFDAVYIPARTELLIAAEQCGAATLSGVDLFVFQGIDAFRYFAGNQTTTAAIDAQVDSVRDHYFQQLVLNNNSRRL